MSRRALIPFRMLLGPLCTLALGFALPGAAAADARVSKAYGQLPLHFEVNQGQTHEDVRFLARGSGYSLYLTPGEAVFVLTKPNPDKKRGWHGKRDWRSKHERPKVQTVLLRMAIVGAAPAPLVSGLDELPGKANYFIGNDPAKWRANVPTYAKVRYREVYPGIDLLYYGNQRQLEYDFIVAPGADPQSIVLDFQGADRVEVNAEGELVLHLAGATLRQRKPVIYQEVGGMRREIAGGYVLTGANRVGFQVPAYDRSRPLVIDPVLSYSTYLGGGGDDEGEGIAVDADGNAYVTGSTIAFSDDTFPTTPGAFQTTADLGVVRAFVTKLNPTGSALVYSTYLGGDFDAHGSGIAVDTDGNAYVTGRTLGFGFPTTAGAFQTTKGGSFGGTYDAFVTKLNPTGSALVYSTYLGGGGNDGGSGIAVDADGNAYVTGFTGANDLTPFPTTPGAFQTTGNNVSFVTKLNPLGSALVYSTYLGGHGGNGIAVDADGNAYVTGSARDNFPTTPGAFQPTFGGGSCDDAVVTKLNPTGSGLVYSTYLGGGGNDGGTGIAVDADGNAYVTGRAGANFPTTPGAFQPAFAGDTSGDPSFCGNFDVFVTKLNPVGSALVYSTYLGGSGDDLGEGIAVDTLGNAYVTGSTISNDFPTTPGSFQSANAGSSDAFVTKLNPVGSALVHSTYLGGSDHDMGGGIAVDTLGNAYLTGRTASTNFPTTPGAFQSTKKSGSFTADDVFVAKIVDAATRFEQGAATYTGAWTTYGSETGTFSGGTVLASNAVGSTATFTFTGTDVSWIGVKCNVCGIATVSIDGGIPTTVDTFGPAAPGSLTSEPVFTASGLASGVSHTLMITVTGTTSSPLNLSFGGTHVAVDAFDVMTGGGAAPPLLPPLALPPTPVVPVLSPVLGL